MHRFLIVLTFGLLSFTPVISQNKEATPKEFASLQGTWKAVKMVATGREATADEMKTDGMVFEFSGTEMTPTRGDKKSPMPAKVTIDTKKDPAHIDIEMPGEGKMIGIFMIEKNTLTLCMTRSGKPRPEKLESTKETGTVLFVLEKVAK